MMTHHNTPAPRRLGHFCPRRASFPNAHADPAPFQLSRASGPDRSAQAIDTTGTISHSRPVCHCAWLHTQITRGPRKCSNYCRYLVSSKTGSTGRPTSTPSAELTSSAVASTSTRHFTLARRHVSRLGAPETTAPTHLQVAPGLAWPGIMTHSTPSPQAYLFTSLQPFASDPNSLGYMHSTHSSCELVKEANEVDPSSFCPDPYTYSLPPYLTYLQTCRLSITLSVLISALMASDFYAVRQARKTKEEHRRTGAVGRSIKDIFCAQSKSFHPKIILN
ncbi:unnamed protein product [Protopolystoma xenopodis]|uniref:Uncharacterized protein n=1 Tax=Protopolystoma xenopodis TaxID=117903 RepID=A0A3S5CJT2_9PLAT|nr:unnamed protein product [Protopolystoma xenopodis]